MAAKKENKMIGYLVISIIPIIGIIWAGVDGSIHSTHVKNAIEAEKQFETHFVEKLNSTTFKIKDKDGNYEDVVTPQIESANIVSIVPTTYETKKPYDPYPATDTSKSSYTIKLEADVVTPGTQTTLPTYNLEFEFYVTQEIFTSFTENFDNGKIGVHGELDNTFETYYSYNPKNAPIYKLIEHFDDYYQNVHLFSYQEEVYIGTGPEYIVGLIEEIGEVTLDNASDIKDIEKEYNALNEQEKSQVTNYNDLVAALDKLEVLEFEDQVNKVPALDTLTYNTAKNAFDNNVMKLYNGLSAEQLQTVSADVIEKYHALENYRYVIEIVYRVGKYNDGTNTKDSYIKTTVDSYNKLTVAQKALLETFNTESINYYEELEKEVAAYNEGKEEGKKITLSAKDQEPQSN